MTNHTGYLKKSIKKSLVKDIIDGRMINKEIEKLRRLGYSELLKKIEVNLND